MDGITGGSGHADRAPWAHARRHRLVDELGARLRRGSTPLVVLVHSFDGYRRYWDAAAHHAAQHLPPSVPKVFATSQRPVGDERFEALRTGHGWFVDRLAAALEVLRVRGHRYVLYLQEDMWLTAPVPTSVLDDLVAVMDRHRLDSVKLGRLALAAQDLASIRERCGPLEASASGLAADLRWFGPHDWAMSHHVTVFRTTFLLETLRAARRAGERGPVRHERYCSAHLRTRTRSSAAHRAPYRIATWVDEPLVEYVHASARGRLTDEGRALLEGAGLGHLHRPDLPGEVFPRGRGR